MWFHDAGRLSDYQARYDCLCSSCLGPERIYTFTLPARGDQARPLGRERGHPGQGQQAMMGLVGRLSCRLAQATPLPPGCAGVSTAGRSASSVSTWRQPPPEVRSNPIHDPSAGYDGRQGKRSPNHTHTQAEHLGLPPLCAVLCSTHRGPASVPCAGTL
jgi:hypothetical protein